MVRTVSRSARTGRFVKASTARRNPKTTSTETVGKGTGNKKSVHRSVTTGAFVSARYAASRPTTTIRQQV